MLQRICDWGECENHARFMLGFYESSSSTKLVDTADVCSIEHAQKFWKVFEDDSDGLTLAAESEE